jgi:glyoxylase-like metal-dependent hydrolase (beta-lactamase superfamily II)
MADRNAPRRFNWRILQSGSLPLRPDGSLDQQAEHRCAATLLWPEDESPTPDNTVLVDPCFTAAGYDEAAAQLAALGAEFRDIGRIFVTHLHADHMLHLPSNARAGRLATLRLDDGHEFGLAAVDCPGHHPMLLALTFAAPDERQVWIVGDAVLDEAWLRAWKVYWPNQYSPPEVMQTWRSVGQIVARADVIVPGHGPAFGVTPDLVRDLLETFPNAPYADQCPQVIPLLRQRLERFG